MLRETRLRAGNLLQVTAENQSTWGREVAAENFAWWSTAPSRRGDPAAYALIAEAYEAIAAGDVIQGRFITPGGVLAGGLRESRDLQAEWASLSTAEKRMEIAKARGLGGLFFSSGRRGIYRGKGASGGPGFTRTVARDASSFTWGHAGPLLEELAQDHALMLRHDVEGWSLSVTLGPEARGQQTPLDAIALAYVLVKTGAPRA